MPLRHLQRGEFRPRPGAGRLPPSGASEPVQIILDQGNNQFPQLRLPDSNGGLSVLHAGSVFSFTGKKKHMTLCQAGPTVCSSSTPAGCGTSSRSPLRDDEDWGRGLAFRAGQWQVLHWPTWTRGAAFPAGLWQEPQAPLEALDMVLVFPPKETEMSRGGLSVADV